MLLKNIINEAISASTDGAPVELNLENVDASNKIKKQMEEEFTRIVRMLNFTENGHDMFKRWYIDGRMYHHLIVEPKSPKLGIQEIRNIDAAKVRKIKDVGDIRPGTRKGKIDYENIWMVKIAMPKRLMKNIDRGYKNLDRNKVQDIMANNVVNMNLEPAQEVEAQQEAPADDTAAQ